jgi:arylsulfatase A-like enzyme
MSGRARSGGGIGRVLGALAPVLLAAGCGPAAPPAIIVFDIDTLRADHLGCYGYSRDTSPILDAFASEAARFDWAFAQAPYTGPSQASILTSLYPSAHGFLRDDEELPLEAVTLAEVLRDGGYRTAGFIDGGYMSDDFNMGQGFELYENVRGRGLARSVPLALGWLREHGSEPFLLLIHTYDTHTPYTPKPPYRELFLDGLAPPTPGFEPTVEVMEGIRQSVWTDQPRSLPDNDLEYAKALYDAEIRYVDDWFGRFVEGLRELEIYDRSVIVVLSDHGEEFQEHGSVLHEKLYATVTRIPLLIRLPGGRRAGTISTIVEAVDVMPTLVELAGLEVPGTVHGVSLLPRINGEAAGPGRAFGESPYYGRERFLAEGGRRLLISRDRPEREELYDFPADPLEQDDLAAADPAAVDRLRGRIDAWERWVAGARIGDGAASPPDEETLRQLRALGYLR